MWIFIQDQILGMKWLNVMIGNLLTVLGIDITGRIGGSIQFFIYDVIKIVVLLCTLIFMISYIQSYFPPERTKTSVTLKVISFTYHQREKRALFYSIS